MTTLNFSGELFHKVAMNYLTVTNSKEFYGFKDKEDFILRFLKVSQDNDNAEQGLVDEISSEIVRQTVIVK